MLVACSRSNVTAHIAVAEVQGDNAPAVEAVAADLDLHAAKGPQGLVTVKVPLTLRLKRSMPTGRPSATPTLMLLDGEGQPLCYAQLDDDCRERLVAFLNDAEGGQQQFTFTAVMRRDDFPKLAKAVALRLTGFSFILSPDRALAEPDRV